MSPFFADGVDSSPRRWRDPGESLSRLGSCYLLGLRLGCDMSQDSGAVIGSREKHSPAEREMVSSLENRAKQKLVMHS